MSISIALIISAYLLGSIASAIIVCRLMGLSDPRLDGSGNPGATNVMRLHGKKAGMFTLAGDMLKGVLPVLLAKYIGAEHVVIALTGLAAFVGHLFPLFFNFKGGKGVATLLGVLIATSWPSALLFMGSWFLMAKLFRYSSLAGITAGILTPVYSFLLLPGPAYTICFSLMALLLVWRHRSNIRNLLNGTEPRAAKRG